MAISTAFLIAIAGVFLTYPLHLVLVLTLCETQSCPINASDDNELRAVLRRSSSSSLSSQGELEGPADMRDESSGQWEPLTNSLVGTIRALRQESNFGLFRAFGYQVLYSCISEAVLTLVLRSSSRGLLGDTAKAASVSSLQLLWEFLVVVSIRLALLPLDLITLWQILRRPARSQKSSVLANWTPGLLFRACKESMIPHILVCTIPEVFRYCETQVFRMPASTSSLLVPWFNLFWQIGKFAIFMVPLQSLAYTAYYSSFSEHLENTLVPLRDRPSSLWAFLEGFYDIGNSCTWYCRTWQATFTFGLIWIISLAINLVSLSLFKVSS